MYIIKCTRSMNINQKVIYSTIPIIPLCDVFIFKYYNKNNKI